MASVRKVIVAINPNMEGKNHSVLQNLFGFVGRRGPRDPTGASTLRVSLLSQIDALKGHHIHINHIAIGWLNELNEQSQQSNSSEKPPQHINQLDYAIYRLRFIYGNVGLGIGRVLLYFVDKVDANGFDDIEDKQEYHDLISSYYVDNDGLDCFVVNEVSAPKFEGKSPVDGSTIKRGKRSGLLAGGITRRTIDGFARTYAHEVGHYLGLEHNHGEVDDCEADCPQTFEERSRLMAQTQCVRDDNPPGCLGPGVRLAIKLTSEESDEIHTHGMVREGISDVG